MSQPTKSTSNEPKAKDETTETDQALPDAALEKVSGGKAQLSEIKFTHVYDKSTPKLT